MPRGKKWVVKFKKLLEAERVKTEAKIEQYRSQDSKGEPVEPCPDFMEWAGRENARNMLSRQEDRSRRYLKKVGQALARIRAGIFGLCEECGGEISSKRLEVRPVARHCIACKEEIERKEKQYFHYYPGGQGNGDEVVLRSKTAQIFIKPRIIIDE